MTFNELKPSITKILNKGEAPVEHQLLKICELLKENISYYNWVGFYFKNGDKNELRLSSFAGKPTDHLIIPFGKGICGQVAVSNSNFLVPDIQAQDNYIACSLDVKAEIVVPMFVQGKNIGQIDIDSSIPDPFSEEDERFLEWVNEQIASSISPRRWKFWEYGK